MNEVFLSLGSNVGDRSFNLAKGLEMIGQRTGQVVLQSGIYETEPWGCETQLTFYNQVVKLDTKLGPIDLLEAIHDTEMKLGRDPEAPRFSDRVLDIDILFFGNLVVKLPELVIPHPFLQERKFVLVPFAEISPGTEHPIFQKTISQLLSECTDEAKILRQIR
jgi:2-amino-4-hydroxy-6-hydroxymethyldihydropteridine diphosphokinase